MDLSYEMMSTQNGGKNSGRKSPGFRSSTKLQILFQHQYHFLLLLLQDRQTVLTKILSHMSISCICLVKSSQMHWQQKQTFRKVGKATVEAALGWKPINHKKILESFLEYRRLVPEAHRFWSSFQQRQVTELMLYSMLIFLENEGDNRKSKKMQQLFQHFSEHCKHYLPKQQITYKH